MSVVATLGPKDTFSDMATQRYLLAQGLSSKVAYFPTLKTAFNAIGNEADWGVLPIENLSEGYVQVVLDGLMATDLFIRDEILLPIKFALVTNCQSLAEVRSLYVQFVAHGQCSEFIESLQGIAIHNTQSNMESLNALEGATEPAAAVIPHHVLKEWSKDCFKIDNVTDFAHNQTRFLVLGKQPQKIDPALAYKTTLVVRDDHDKPGVLGSIVTALSDRRINMTSIMSRPTKSQLGKYHFFIDIEGHCEQDNIAAAIAQINLSYQVKVLGSYQAAVV
ncbi:prephenate dehydratase [Motilimonas sp. 1_MG-2023]|uniref:prephenate dehydratase n=1 Tax=Motilimonas TaxID=1914248 RepID=UPI0026E2F189|nr:prephenate dehydratase domain-containing protein [Motilimonas sp. 1_MG-2023]MDO6528122.1 prephenate dehydratase domain-containing protein [Motilimonas sp. 1_MG-2023]